MPGRNATVEDPRGKLAMLLGYSAGQIERMWRTYLFSHDVPRSEQDIRDALPWFRRRLELFGLGVVGE